MVANRALSRPIESFKVLSAYHLPLSALHATVYTSPTNTHDPLLLVPVGRTVRAFNLTHFGPRPPPPFPLEEDRVVALTKRMRLDDVEEEGEQRQREQGQRGETGEGEDVPAPEGEQEGESENDAQEGDAADIVWDHHREGYVRPGPSRYKELFTAVESWDIDLTAFDQEKRAAMPDVTTCEIASDGRVILGAGDKGTLYVWRLAGPRPA